MNKKAISPLIATVLIIGFTIVLAALVMQWGGGLFKSVQEQTGKTSDFKIICSSKLTGLEVSVKDKLVTIDNKNNQDIKGFMFRGYKEDGAVQTFSTKAEDLANGFEEVTPAEGLDAYGVKKYTLEAAAATKFIQVGVFPIVTVQNEDLTCENEWKVTVSP